MKILQITFILLIFATGAGAADKIEGAFGLELGKPFQSSTPPITSFNSLYGFEFTPKTPNPMFSQYIVFVTPNSHLVYNIVAIGLAPDDQANRDAIKKIRAIAGHKYEETPTANDVIEQGERRIFVRATLPTFKRDGFSYELNYLDTSLAAKAVREQFENEQKDLLKDADTTGF